MTRTNRHLSSIADPKCTAVRIVASSRGTSGRSVKRRGQDGRATSPRKQPFDQAPKGRLVAFPSRLGWMAMISRGDLLCQLTFGHGSKREAIKALNCPLDTAVGAPKSILLLAERLQAYAAGSRDDFRDVRVDLGDVRSFGKRVLECCRQIPYGTTVGYAELAAKAGVPRASRAVGNCMAGNRLPIVIPCHRVVRSDGRLGNYSAPGGSETKRRLLQMESSN